MKVNVSGTVHSEKGFYIGDICYVLPDDIYHGFWGEVHNFEDGIFEVPNTGFSFAVGSTAYGDGTFYDEAGREYSVDAGVIGIIPEELAKPTRGGHFFPCSGTAYFDSEDGSFSITLPSREGIYIETKGDSDEDDDEY